MNKKYASRVSKTKNEFQCCCCAIGLEHSEHMHALLLTSLTVSGCLMDSCCSSAALKISLHTVFGSSCSQSVVSQQAKSKSHRITTTSGFGGITLPRRPDYYQTLHEQNWWLMQSDKLRHPGSPTPYTPAAPALGATRRSRTQYNATARFVVPFLAGHTALHRTHHELRQQLGVVESHLPLVREHGRHRLVERVHLAKRNETRAAPGSDSLLEFRPSALMPSDASGPMPNTRAWRLFDSKTWHVLLEGTSHSKHTSAGVCVTSRARVLRLVWPHGSTLVEVAGPGRWSGFVTYSKCPRTRCVDSRTKRPPPPPRWACVVFRSNARRLSTAVCGNRTTERTWWVSKSETVACSCRSSSSTKGMLSPSCVAMNFPLHCGKIRQNAK